MARPSAEDAEGYMSSPVGLEAGRQVSVKVSQVPLSLLFRQLQLRLLRGQLLSRH